MSDRIFNVLGAVLAVGAAAATQKVISATWRFVMDDTPPDNPEDPDTSLAEAMSWAIASGAGVTIAKLLTARKWTRYYIDATGRRPGEKKDKRVAA